MVAVATLMIPPNSLIPDGPSMAHQGHGCEPACNFGQHDGKDCVGFAQPKRMLHRATGLRGRGTRSTNTPGCKEEMTNRPRPAIGTPHWVKAPSSAKF